MRRPTSGKTVGGFEELVLLAVVGLGPDAYGVPLRVVLEAALAEPVSVGRLYEALGRLEAQGYLASWQGDPTPVRGGRAKRFFRLVSPGLQALHAAESRRRRLRREGPGFNREAAGAFPPTPAPPP